LYALDFAAYLFRAAFLLRGVFMNLLELPAGKVEKCYYCGKRAGFLSLFFGRPVCGKTCAQLLHMEWYEVQRQNNELDSPYHVFKEHCNIY
jgi:hypothetical protein